MSRPPAARRECSRLPGRHSPARRGRATAGRSSRRGTATCGACRSMAALPRQSGKRRIRRQASRCRQMPTVPHSFATVRSSCGIWRPAARPRSSAIRAGTSPVLAGRPTADRSCTPRAARSSATSRRPSIPASRSSTRSTRTFPARCSPSPPMAERRKRSATPADSARAAGSTPAASCSIARRPISSGAPVTRWISPPARAPSCTRMSKTNSGA